MLQNREADAVVEFMFLFDDAVAHKRMLLHKRELLGGQLARLVEDLERYLGLAHVVQQSGDADIVDVL